MITEVSAKEFLNILDGVRDDEMAVFIIYVENCPSCKLLVKTLYTRHMLSKAFIYLFNLDKASAEQQEHVIKLAERTKIPTYYPYLIIYRGKIPVVEALGTDYIIKILDAIVG